MSIACIYKKISKTIMRTKRKKVENFASRQACFRNLSEPDVEFNLSAVR